MEPNGLPSRTAIFAAAARALGSREPDPSVRNPDWLADRLIGPDELALITEHPIGKALDLEFTEAMNDPDVFGFAWVMLVRTRFIDERMEHAVREGATQLVILGAGFDSRAHRFAELLKDAAVIEIDHPATQEYKRRRVDAALGGPPPNLVYAPADFACESLRDVLLRVGFHKDRKTFFICEGLSMYVPEPGIRQTLGAIAEESAAGSVVLFEYVNRDGLDAMTRNPSGLIKAAGEWGEPFVFGVPEGRDREFFLETGLGLGDVLRIFSPEAIARYATRSDGTRYGAHLDKVFMERREAALRAMDDDARKQAIQAATSFGYGLAELAVLPR